MGLAAARRPAVRWCVGGCGWICAECVAVHRQHAGLFAGHELLAEPPPRPFWEDLNFDKDVSAHAVAPITQLQLTSTSSLFPTQLQPQPDRCEVLTVDFNDPRLIKRDFKNWRKRMAAASKDEAVPVVSFVGPTGSGKSFLLSSLMDPEDRKHRGPTVSAAGQHVLFNCAQGKSRSGTAACAYVMATRDLPLNRLAPRAGGLLLLRVAALQRTLIVDLEAVAPLVVGAAVVLVREVRELEL